MTNITNSSTEGPALAKTLEKQRKELAKQLAHARHERDKAARVAAEATARFEHFVASVASSDPGREDWHKFPGALTRAQVLDHGKLNTVSLHRIMARRRRAG